MHGLPSRSLSAARSYYSAKPNMLAVPRLKQTNLLAFKCPTFITRIWSWREPILWDRGSSAVAHASAEAWPSYPVGASPNEYSVLVYESIDEEIGKPHRLLFSLGGRLLRQKNTGAGRLDGAECRLHPTICPLCLSGQCFKSCNMIIVKITKKSQG